MKTIEQSVGQLSNESPSTSASATTTAAPSSASTNQTKPTRTASTSDAQLSPSLAKQPAPKPKSSVTSSQNQQQPLATLGYSDVTTPSDDDVIRLPSVKNLSSLFSEQKQVNVSDVSASKRVSK